MMEESATSYTIGHLSKRSFNPISFVTGFLVLLFLGLAVSLSTAWYTSTTVSRIVGYVNRPPYSTFTSKDGKLSFDYPNYLHPARLCFNTSCLDDQNVDFSQLSVSSRVLKSNEHLTMMSLLSGENFSDTADAYYASEEKDFYNHYAGLNESAKKLHLDQVKYTLSTGFKTVNGVRVFYTEAIDPAWGSVTYEEHTIYVYTPMRTIR